MRKTAGMVLLSSAIGRSGIDRKTQIAGITAQKAQDGQPTAFRASTNRRVTPILERKRRVSGMA
jgi:hypothetical protein